MGSFIFYLVLAVLALAVLVIVPRVMPATVNHYGREERSRGRLITMGVSALVLIVALCLVASSFINRVPPRTVGVETVWGKYSRTLEAGWHPAAPWANVETFPTTFQESAMDIHVGFKGGYSGTQPVKGQWTITSAEAKSLWERFRTFDQTNAQLVDNAIKEETVRVFRGYTPSEIVNGRTLENGKTEDTSEQARQAIQKGVTERLAPYGVTVDSLSYTAAVQPDEDAKAAIKIDQEAIAKRNRAAIEVDTAKDEAAADKIRNQEASPESIELECYDVTRTWDQGKNGPLPAMWNCAGNSATPVANVR